MAGQWFEEIGTGRRTEAGLLLGLGHDERRYLLWQDREKGGLVFSRGNAQLA